MPEARFMIEATVMVRNIYRSKSVHADNAQQNYLSSRNYNHNIDKSVITIKNNLLFIWLNSYIWFFQALNVHYLTSV